MSENNNFQVYTLQAVTDDTPMFGHWSEGLTMHITKNGVSIKLTSDEIRQLMNAMPRTFGGSY